MQNAFCFGLVFFSGSWGISIPHAGLARSDGESGHLESSRYGSCPVCFWCATGRNFFLCFLAAYFCIYFSSSPAFIMTCLWHVVLWRRCSKLCGFEKNQQSSQTKINSPNKKTLAFGCLGCPQQLHSLSSWVRYFWSPKSGVSAWAVLQVLAGPGSQGKVVLY